MKIERLQVRGYKLLRDFELDFVHGGAPRPFTVLVGRNATGKTSVLRAIALAAAGRDGALQLTGDAVSSFFDRRESAPGDVEIDATFALPPAPQAGKRKARWIAADPLQPGPRDALDLHVEVKLTVRTEEPAFDGDSWYLRLSNTYHEKTPEPDPRSAGPSM